jgi:L-arabinose isomerase
MKDLKSYCFWFVTGSQLLYGEETLQKVDEHASIISQSMDNNPLIPFKIIPKPVLTSPEAIQKLILEANSDATCAGIITWMHTFSPAKMWIGGLTSLQKPLLHFHTQFNRDIPWDSIDMNFMNLNQSAHGDREYGYIGARLRIARKIVVGYWEDGKVLEKISTWMRAAVAFTYGKTLKVARFGDNMREVAVTEGDKVEAQIKLGWSINGYGVGDLVKCLNEITPDDAAKRLLEYENVYDFSAIDKNNSETLNSILEQAKIELAMQNFLEKGNFDAFTTTFEDLVGLKQLPGLAVQRLMSQGYGFGAEGDWKTSALVRTMKIMAHGLNQGTSFMEDYTYHFEPGQEMILGAHMLEVCPSIAATKPKVEVHPLSIGGKADPARLVFDGDVGPAICASLIDLGNRFRLIINEVEAVKMANPMPNLPVARIMWQPKPSLCEAAEAWILCGGAHHTSFSFSVTTEHLVDWAQMAGIECLIIDEKTNLRDLQNEIKWNELAWHLKI